MREDWKVKPPLPGDEVENGEPVRLIKRGNAPEWERFTGIVEGLARPLTQEQQITVEINGRPNPAPDQSSLRHRVVSQSS